MNTKPILSARKNIEFRDVSFHINDILDRSVLSGVTLEIPQGETLVLLGRSGSGKTTLLKLINECYCPQKGKSWSRGSRPAIGTPSVSAAASDMLFRTQACSLTS